MIPQMPCTANNAKSKLESQISDMTAKHIHKQIQDILLLIENENNDEEKEIMDETE